MEIRPFHNPGPKIIAQCAMWLIDYNYPSQSPVAPSQGPVACPTLFQFIFPILLLNGNWKMIFIMNKYHTEQYDSAQKSLIYKPSV